MRVWLRASAVCAFLVGYFVASVQIATTVSGEELWEWPAQKCPKAQSGEAVFENVIFLENGEVRSKTTSVSIELDGVEPKWPNLSRDGFDYTNGAEQLLADCLIGAPATFDELSWSGGRLTAKLSDLGPLNYSYPEDKIGFGSHVFIATCPDGDADFTPLVCEKPIKTTIRVSLSPFEQAKLAVVTDFVTGQKYSSPQRLVKARAIEPYPHKIITDDDGQLIYVWAYSGLVPPISVGFELPTVSALGYVVRSFERPFWIFIVSGSYLAYSLSAVAAVLAALVILWRYRSRIAMVLLAVGVLLMGGLAIDLPVDSCNGTRLISAVFGWALIIICLALMYRGLVEDPLSSYRANILALKQNRARNFLASSHTAFAALATAVLCSFALPVNAARADGRCEAPRYSGWDEFVWILPGLILFALTLVGVTMLLIRITRLSFLAGDQDSGLTWPAYVTCCVAFPTLYFTVGYVLGRPFSTAGISGEEPDFRERSQLFYSASIDLYNSLSLALVQLVPLLLISIIALVFKSQIEGRPKPWQSGAAVISLLFCLAVPWSQSGTVFIIVNMPIWLIQFGVVYLFVRHLLAREWPSNPSKSRKELLELSATDANVALESGYKLLSLGPRNSPLENAIFAARIAGAVSVVPVFYFVWTAFEGFDIGMSSGWQAFLIVIALLSEAARWLVSGFIFGYLYAILPGRGGPVKALAFASIWALSSVLPVLIARAADVDNLQQVIYRGAQFAIFIMVVAVIYDLATLRLAGGSWRDLQKAYALSNYGELVAAIAPFLLLAVTLAQQIAAGSGLEIAETLISGVNDAVTGTLNTPHK